MCPYAEGRVCGRFLGALRGRADLVIMNWRGGRRERYSVLPNFNRHPLGARAPDVFLSGCSPEPAHIAPCSSLGDLEARAQASHLLSALFVICSPWRQLRLARVASIVVVTAPVVGLAGVRLVDVDGCRHVGRHGAGRAPGSESIHRERRRASLHVWRPPLALENFCFGLIPKPWGSNPCGCCRFCMVLDVEIILSYPPKTCQVLGNMF